MNQHGETNDNDDSEESREKAVSEGRAERRQNLAGPGPHGEQHEDPDT